MTTALPPSSLKPKVIPEPLRDERGEIIYPSSDGLPMTWSTTHYKWLTFLKDGLELLFLSRPDVLVLGDVMWYPVEGRPDICVGPDVMVCIGVPKGERPCYKQWVEGGIAPQVVFEVLSCGNTVSEMQKKEQFYARHGVQEYIVFDPEDLLLSIHVRNQAGLLELVPEPQGWTSPLMGVTFWLDPEAKLNVVLPDGSKMLHLQERHERLKAEAQRASEEAARADEAAEKAARLAAKLRELGIDPDTLQ